MTQYSHSRVDTFLTCPYRYRLRYIDKFGVLPNTDDPTNALILGSALHEGIEKGVEAGVSLYKNSFPIISDLHLHEVFKLENLIPKVRKLIPDNAIFEREIKNDHFIGFLDMLIPVNDRGDFELWDFKYSNAKDRYLASGQIHEYKYFFEKINPMCQIVKMGYIFIPKTAIRQKKTENLFEFRKRLNETLDAMEIEKVEVKYDPNKVIDFVTNIKVIQETTEFPKNECRLCDFCDFKLYCKEGLDYMILPENKKRNVNVADRKKIWLYGAPFSGKTTLADAFPNAIMLNTDGNINSFTSPVVEIKEVLEGRQKIPAWENFKYVVDELQKGGTGYETVVVDLVEDTYEHCRRYCYEKLGIEHESDNSFKAWDYIRNEFLTTIKKLMTLNYNIVLISHEDMSKDITRKSGDKITSIRPNINEKAANKLAGMVDIVARVVADGDNRTLQFKSDDVVFGGGRLKLDKTIIPLSYKALSEVYDNQGKPEPVKEEPVKVEPEDAPWEEAKKEEKPVEESPKRRRRVRE